MNCINCGKEIKAEFNNCPYCGKPLQMVPDYSIYDEDDINVLLEGTKDISSVNVKNNIEEPSNTPKQTDTKQKKSKGIITIILFICIVIVVIGILAKCLIDMKHDSSYEYQMKQGAAAVHKNDYASAEQFYQKALSLRPEDVKVHLELAELYLEMDNRKEAMSLLKETVQLDPSSKEAYQMLIDIYEEADAIDAIVALRRNVTDQTILNLFTEYMVETPTISLPSGTYSEDIKITLYAKKGVEIYYTVDGSNPITNGILYDKKIEIKQDGMHTVKAVAKNSKGIFSEVVLATYVIEFKAPADPVVTPNGGEFHKETYVTITVPSGCNAYYTWDRSNPTAESELYTGPILVPEGYHLLSVIIINPETGKESGIYRGVFEYSLD